MKKIIYLVLIFALCGCQSTLNEKTMSLNNRYFINLFSEKFDENKACVYEGSNRTCIIPEEMNLNFSLINKIKQNKNVVALRPFWQLFVSNEGFEVEINGIKKEINEQRSVSSVAISYDMKDRDNVILSYKEPTTNYIPGYLKLSNSSDLGDNGFSTSMELDINNNQYFYYLPVYTTIINDNGESEYKETKVIIEIIGIISEGYTGRGSIFIEETDMKNILTELNVNINDSNTYLLDVKDQNTDFLKDINPNLYIEYFN